MEQYKETISKKEVKIWDKHVSFWGSAFSNFFPCDFELEGRHWLTSEQYFMAKKAQYFNDMETYEKILNTMHPKDAKKLGREVKNFNADEWMKVCKDIMHDGVYAKFSQNKDLKDFLLDKDFEGKGFIEGSPVDGIWGVKIDWKSPNIDDERNWNGLNLLGKVLDQVREELR